VVPLESLFFNSLLMLLQMALAEKVLPRSDEFLTFHFL
jgi:hypothetical protein